MATVRMFAEVGRSGTQTLREWAVMIRNPAGAGFRETVPHRALITQSDISRSPRVTLI